MEGTSRDTPQVVFEDVAPQDALPQGTPTPTCAYSQSAALPPSSRFSVPGRASDWPSYGHAHAYLLEDEYRGCLTFLSVMGDGIPAREESVEPGQCSQLSQTFKTQMVSHCFEQGCLTELFYDDRNAP